MNYISRDELVKAIKNVFDMTEQYVGAEFLELVYGMPKANVVSRSEFENCRNELCYKCGEYKNRHLGACDGCRYKP